MRAVLSLVALLTAAACTTAPVVISAQPVTPPSVPTPAPTLSPARLAAYGGLRKAARAEALLNVAHPAQKRSADPDHLDRRRATALPRAGGR